MDRAVFNDLQVLWDYMRLGQEPEKADCILALGCYDEMIPRRAAALYHAGFAPWVVFSGGLGRNTQALWHTSEAERFAAIAMAEGVPESAVLLESRSANSAENFLFTKELLARMGIPAGRILAVHKPYMERRVFAAAAVYWPEAEFIVTSPQVTVEEHIQSAGRIGMTERGVIETVVGDIQRMELYPRLGYQIPQEIPPAVWAAYDRLVAAGYTGQLVKT